MNRLICSTGVVAVGLLLAGCAPAAPPQPPTGADLKGAWEQTGVGYERGVLVTWRNQTVVIEQADGQGFTGYKEYTRDGEPPQKETINGAIAADGRILMTDEDGLFDGRLVDGAIVGQYAETGDDAGVINIELTRRE